MTGRLRCRGHRWSPVAERERPCEGGVAAVSGTVRAHRPSAVGPVRVCVAAPVPSQPWVLKLRALGEPTETIGPSKS